MAHIVTQLYIMITILSNILGNVFRRVFSLEPSANMLIRKISLASFGRPHPEGEALPRTFRPRSAFCEAEKRGPAELGPI